MGDDGLRKPTRVLILLLLPILNGFTYSTRCNARFNALLDNG